VLTDPGDEVIGCVYIYPAAHDDVEAEVRSWVRASRAALDAPLYATVLAWLHAEWPFGTFSYASRDLTGLAPRRGLAQPGVDPPATS
jgi:hypothetical protein